MIPPADKTTKVEALDERPKTLYQKHIDSHTVCELDDQGHVLLYIDRQVANEYTSPQAFSGLREAGRKVWRPAATLCVVDHVNPTTPQRIAQMPDAGGALQVNYFEQNCRDFGIELFDVLDKRQGIEHVVAPEQGFILPGMVVAAGDSHTTTYGALGAFAFGIGTSEIEHLLATQTLVYKRLDSMRVTVEGTPGPGLVSKDIIMELIRQIGASGATGYAIEFTGAAISALSVEARMTICNMAVEAGARGAFMAPDEKVFDYLKDKPRAPKGALWEQAVERWRALFTDHGATIASLVVGSILGMNRTILVQGMIRMFVPLAIGTLAAVLAGIAVGVAFGYSVQHTFFFIIVPIIGGGIGEGILPHQRDHLHRRTGPVGNAQTEAQWRWSAHPRPRRERPVPRRPRGRPLDRLPLHGSRRTVDLCFFRAGWLAGETRAHRPATECRS